MIQKLCLTLREMGIGMEHLWTFVHRNNCVLTPLALIMDLLLVMKYQKVLMQQNINTIKIFLINLGPVFSLIQQYMTRLLHAIVVTCEI